MIQADLPASGKPELVDTGFPPVDRDEVIRFLGYPAGAAPGGRLEAALDRWLPEAAAAAAPRAVWALFPIVAIEPRRLRLRGAGGEADIEGAIGQYLRGADWIAAYIATAGPGVERLASRRMAQGDPVAGMIADAVGGERAEAAARAVQARLEQLARPLGLGLTLPYSPGYCGMDLTQQRPLFGLFGGQTAGVRLSDTCLMQPIKSISGLIGLGPAERIGQQGSPCDRCDREDCTMRR